jgi:vesicle transport through interaction with t-SNAREs protein 1
MEARSSSPTQSRQQIQKVKDYRSDLSKLRTDIRKAASSSSSVAGTSTSDASARAELGLGNDFYQTSAGQRDRLLTATDRLNQTSDRIQQGRAQLLETEVG